MTFFHLVASFLKGVPRCIGAEVGTQLSCLDYVRGAQPLMLDCALITPGLHEVFATQIKNRHTVLRGSTVGQSARINEDP